MTGEATAPARVRPYEGMFVVFNKEARKTHEYLEEHVKGLLEKVHAKVVRFTKWDQRQLAFEINGQREGIYYLCYFEAPTDAIAHLKRESELSELVLRALILALDRIPTEEELRGEGGFDGGGRRPRGGGGGRGGPMGGGDLEPDER